MNLEVARLLNILMLLDREWCVREIGAPLCVEVQSLDA
ncbi:hypothetical protein HMPREF1247_0371 [Atopobium sp. BV3Ac4]|nr:hypothetical protein HMPREF1247_0371 [Atopobium sp. BV3Ac4]